MIHKLRSTKMIQIKRLTKMSDKNDSQKETRKNVSWIRYTKIFQKNDSQMNFFTK